MARVAWCIVVLMVMASVSAISSSRVRRGYNSGYGESSSGYGRGSDERDASASEESGGGCNNGGSGYGGNRGYGYSASQERAYNRDGWKSDTRGGRSLTRSSASAVASAAAASFGLNQKAKIVK